MRRVIVFLIFNRSKSLATEFYHKLIGSFSHVFSQDKADQVSGLIKKMFLVASVMGMNDAITRAEIQKVLFSLSKNKAPSLDGFSADFFHKTQPLIGDDVCEVVLKFFQHGQLFKEVNSTILTLVPNKKNPSFMGDYSPISYCNIIYKCITKILANRMIPRVEEVISSNQGDFFPGRGIAKNVLLAQETVSDYHKEKGKARCTLKIDLMKAYDFLSWECILRCLQCFGAPPRYIAWIWECITSPSFSIALNGTLVGYFKGRKGLS